MSCIFETKSLAPNFIKLQRQCFHANMFAYEVKPVYTESVFRYRRLLLVVILAGKCREFSVTSAISSLSFSYTCGLKTKPLCGYTFKSTSRAFVRKNFLFPVFARVEVSLTSLVYFRANLLDAII
jgi:hypothetical protein